MKTKKEKITLLVEYTITYDSTREGGRKTALDTALEGCCDVMGVSVLHGFYAAKRGKIRLFDAKAGGTK